MVGVEGVFSDGASFGGEVGNFNRFQWVNSTDRALQQKCGDYRIVLQVYAINEIHTMRSKL
jgi:hypothetical protein